MRSCMPGTLMTVARSAGCTPPTRTGSRWAVKDKRRIAVEGALAKEHASWARTTTLRATDVVVRVIDSENAIVMFKWEITRPEERGVSPLRGNTLLVAAKQDGRWIVVAGQAAAVPVPR